MGLEDHEEHEVNEAKVDPVQELARRREAGEIDPIDFRFDDLQWFRARQEPIERSSANNQAIVIDPEGQEILGYIEYVNAEGTVVTEDFENVSEGQTFILFPDDLGDLATESQSETEPT
ncbi:MAG: hypothetical protein Q7S37_00535 [bacterium]|nr:hypothetical protein [bacterium]